MSSKSEASATASASRAALVHDSFNVLALGIMNALNCLNWRYESSVWTSTILLDGPEEWRARWSGDSQSLFLWITVAYTLVDTLWIFLVPKCVPGPKGLLAHHAVVLLALLIPILYGETHGYTLGIFLTADFNTIFLIIRKKLISLKKEGVFDESAAFSAAFTANDLCFKLTWVVVRLLLFPAWLLYVSWPEWTAATSQTGSAFNWFLIMPVTNFLVVLMNFIWTFSLLQSELKQMRKRHQPVSKAE